MSDKSRLIRIMPGDVDATQGLVLELDARQGRAMRASALAACLLDKLSVDKAADTLIALMQAKKHYMQKAPGGELEIVEKDDASTQLKALTLYFQYVAGKAPESFDAPPQRQQRDAAEELAGIMSSPAAMAALAQMLLPAMLQSDAGREVLMRELDNQT
jgi:hypothetical protein